MQLAVYSVAFAAHHTNTPSSRIHAKVFGTPGHAVHGLAVNVGIRNKHGLPPVRNNKVVPGGGLYSNLSKDANAQFVSWYGYTAVNSGFSSFYSSHSFIRFNEVGYNAVPFTTAGGKLKSMTIAGFAFYSTAAMLTSLASGLRSFCLFRFLLGAGEAGNWPGATKAVSEWFPRRESPLFYDRLMHACFRGGLKSPHVVQEGVNEATILSLVSCGLGVAFVSGATRWRCPESVALLPVTDLKLPLPFALVWRKDNASALLAKFVADVKLLPEVEEFSKR